MYITIIFHILLYIILYNTIQSLYAQNNYNTLMGVCVAIYQAPHIAHKTVWALEPMCIGNVNEYPQCIIVGFAVGL